MNIEELFELAIEIGIDNDEKNQKQNKGFEAF